MRALVARAKLALVGLSLAGSSLTGCAPSAATPAKVKIRLGGTPPDATVIVDDRIAGPLRVVQKLGLALTPGRHRISVERDGYFPWDKIVDATSAPIALEVTLEKLPE